MREIRVSGGTGARLRIRVRVPGAAAGEVVEEAIVALVEAEWLPPLRLRLRHGRW